MTSSLTTLADTWPRSRWYQSLSGTFGVAHVPGTGPGRGSRAGTRCSRAVSVAAARALARARSARGRCLVTPNGAVTVAPLARSAAACDGVATMANLPFACGVTASDMSKPARCRAFGLMWLTRYWFSGCG